MYYQEEGLKTPQLKTSQLKTPQGFIPLATSALIKAEEDKAKKSYNLTPSLLMETAGALSAQEIITLIHNPNSNNADYFQDRSKHTKTRTGLLLCGPGHNGGDGLVTARHLLSTGIKVMVFSPKAPAKAPAKTPAKAPAKTSAKAPAKNSHQINKTLYEEQLERLHTMNTPIHPLKDLPAVEKAITKADWIVDALFGVGLNRDITGAYAQIIKWINTSGKQVISLDTPSGLNIHTGHIKGHAVKAHNTLSFILAKPGFYLMHGPQHVGKLKVLPLGFIPLALKSEHNLTPQQTLKTTNANKPNVNKTDQKSSALKVTPNPKSPINCFLITKSWVKKQMPQRQPTDHKAKHGHLLVLAGSPGLVGAGHLTALASYRMGVGYVTLASQHTSAEQHTTLLQNLPDTLTQHISSPTLFKNKTAVAIGPGLGVLPKTKDLLLTLKKLDLPVVVDADAWTVCVREKLFPLPPHWVCTPHSGEIGKLLGKTGQQVDKDRLLNAEKASKLIGCLLLLKGHHSVLATPHTCWIVPTGNQALAKAGSGDVLTGFIGALMARSLTSFSATATATFTHGLIAEHWTKSGKHPDSLMAQDLKDLLPLTLQRLKEHKD